MNIENTIKTAIAVLAFSQGLFAMAQTSTEHPQLTSIPTLYINTATGSDPADKETYINCDIWLVDGDKTTTYKLDQADNGSGIRGRGNSTWGADKKPWRLKFNKKVKLLGSDFANAKSWTLLANAFDKSLMRNALTYHLGTFMGLEFSPAAQFVDLVMNGTYRGVYQISDQVEVRDKRVEVDADNGWLLEYANAEDKVDDPKITLNYNGTYYGNVQIKNPEFTDDQLSSNQELADAISQYLNGQFLPLYTESVRSELINPRTGYRSMTYPKALIDWYIATEITANWDGFYSIYMFRDPTSATDTQLHFGPLWDEDLAYGNNYETYDRSYFPKQDFYQKLLVECNFSSNVGGYRKMQPVIANLWNDPWFAIAVKMRFDELLNNNLKSYLQGKIEDMRSELSDAAAKNYEKWKINTQDRGYARIHSNYTWKDYVDELKKFVGDRIDLLDKLFTQKAEGIAWLSQSDDYAQTSTNSVNIVIDRPFVKGVWNTLCLPFSLTKDDIAYYFGAGTRVAQFSSTATKDDGTTMLKFTDVESTTAGTPYLVLPALTVDVPFTFLNRTLSTAATITVEHDGIQFIGTYSPLEMTAGDETKLFVGVDNKLYTPSVTNKMKGFRAYFQLPANSSGAKELSFDGSTTGIGGMVVKPNEPQSIYNLSGQRIGKNTSEFPKGIYVVEGKKVVIK